MITVKAEKIRGRKMSGGGTAAGRRVAALLFSALALASSGVVEGGEKVTASGSETSSSLGSRLALHAGWEIQSSCKIAHGLTGARISMAGFHPTGWHAATVPTTLVAALVADKTYPDPYTGMNLRSIPGTSYPVGANFSKLAMPPNSPFRCSWWYRTEFSAPREYEGRVVWLDFGGINNRANIWLNGHKLADAKGVAGAYRSYEFDVTALLARGPKNVLAVEVFAQTPDDLGVNWVDWNPAPPDKDMGLWGDVFLRASGPVALRYPQVVTHFEDASLATADLTVMAYLRNPAREAKQVTVEATIGGAMLRQQVMLAAGEFRDVQFSSKENASLRLTNPAVWWPAGLGAQPLQSLSVRVLTNGAISDEQEIRYGIREITSELTPEGHRLFRINGRRILIRGGGWAPDMLLRPSSERLEAQFEYVLAMHLNTLRLEGKLETDEFFDLADRKGILVMAGWCCCDRWEEWRKWGPGDLEIATASLRSQSLRLRSHPSLLVWMNGSDMPPPANVERAYVNVLRETGWPNPYLSSASETPTRLTGPSGVKMTGPYDFVPRDYWFVDKNKYGGAFGFNTETSPGPAIPPVSCLRRMLGKDPPWPKDAVWDFHSGSGSFSSLANYDRGLNAMYGSPSGLADYLMKSQALAYDGERAMFEAYGGHKYTSTGVIQWMLNNAWPSLIWHLYDYYLQPAGGFFGTKKACEPVHVQYSYDDSGVVVVNSTYKALQGLAVEACLYDFDLKTIFTRKSTVDVDADGTARAFDVPLPSASASPAVYFLKLTLADAEGKTLSTNFYWLSPNRNTYEWRKTTNRFTPVSSFEDLTQLNQLPRVQLEAKGSIEAAPEGDEVWVHVTNPSQSLAFQVHLGIRQRNSGEEILPVLWDDNYFELLPGESYEITVRYLTFGALAEGAVLAVDGWNIEPTQVPLSFDKPGIPRTN
jgi:exo-1,4-beta-D-glucosaminidase